jgi:hypothetical protein
MNEHDESNQEFEQWLHALFRSQLGEPPPSRDTWQHVADRIAQFRHVEVFTGGTHMQPSSSSSHSPTPPRQIRSKWTWLGSSIVVVLLIVLTVGIFHTIRLGTTPGSSGPPTVHITPTGTSVPLDPTYSTGLNSVSMVSPTEGWAVGSYWKYDSKTTNTIGENYALFDHYQDGTWTASIVDINTSAQDGDSTGLLSVSMDSPTDGWAVGNGADNAPLLFHYDGHAWSRETPPADVFGLLSVQMLSPTNGWAVGVGPGKIYDGPILHYDGTAWQVVAREKPYTSFEFGDISFVSPNDGWATGFAFQNAHITATTYLPIYGIIYHNRNGTWEQDASFLNFSPTAISMLPNGDGWVVGIDYPTGSLNNRAPVVYFHHNGSWTKQPVPANSSPEGQWSAIDATHGWLGGSGTSAPIYHYNQGTWQPAQVPPIAGAAILTINSFSFLSANEGWAVGTYQSEKTLTFKSAIFHYQNGKWQIQP